MVKMNSFLANSHYDSMNPRGMWEGIYLQDYFISGKAIIMVQRVGGKLQRVKSVIRVPLSGFRP